MLGMADFATAAPPISVNGTTATEPPGTNVVVNAAAVPGLKASNPGGVITANGITVDLGPGATNPKSYIGAQADGNGGMITLDGSAIRTVTVATGQRGMIAIGTGSAISGTGTTVSLGLGAGTASDNVAAVAQGGGMITLSGATITTLGGANGIGNHGLLATGAGSQITFTAGSISTAARASQGVDAENGGKIILLSGTNVTTTGAGTTAAQTPPLTGSHALEASGANSEIDATGVNLSVSGLLASGARAENGAKIFFTGGMITTSATSSLDLDPASGARVLSGGFIQLDGTTITATGQRGAGISVQDAGSMAVVSNANISTSATRSDAVLLFNGGQATVTDSSLLATGLSAVVVQDAGSKITLTNTSVRSTAPLGYGVRVTNGAMAILTGGSSITEGRDAPALYAANSSITATNVTMRTSGPDNAMGALADGNGTITLNGGSITTSGDTVRVASFPHGVAARNPGGMVTANGTTITTTGLTAMGAVADDGGTTILNNNVITTLGVSSLGLFATVEQNGAQFPAALTGTGITVETSGLLAHGAVSSQHFLPARSLLTLNDSMITTHGDRADGLRAITAGTVNGNNTQVFTEGSDSNGLHARDNGSSVNIDTTTVTTTGSAGHGGFAESGGLLTGNNATVLASGAQASGLYVAGEPGFVSEARFTGGTITNASGATIAVAGNGKVTLTNLTAGGSGQWLKVGTLNDFPPLPTIIGDPLGVTDPEGTETPPSFPLPRAPQVVPGLADVKLDHATVIGSALTMPGSVSNVTMVNNAFWEMTANSNVTNLFIDPSTVHFSIPTGPDFKILTIDKNLSGNNGLFHMNTDLRRIEGDLLVINGLGSGDHQLLIDNRGGSPTGPGQALRVVQTTDGIAGAIFTLANPNQQVPAGMFIYILRLGNNVGNTPDPTAWYLVNEITGGGGGGNGGGGPGTPVLSPEGKVIVNTGAVLPMTWFEELNSLEQRMGELRMSSAPEQAPAEPEGKSTVDGKSVVDGKEVKGNKSVVTLDAGSPRWDAWVRTNGRWMNAETDLGGRFREATWGISLGIDRSFRHAHSRLWLGAFAGYSRADRDFRESGDGKTESVSAGLYATWITDRGWYLDAVAKVNHFDNDLDAVSAFGDQSHSGYRNWGYGVSLEAGRQFTRGSWFFEPQVQAAYTRLTNSDYTTDTGIHVSTGEQDFFQLRAGVVVGRKMEFRGTKLQPYLKASVVETLSSGGRLNADGTDFHATLDGWRFEGGAGIMAQCGPRNQLYFDYTAAVGQKIEQPWGINLGFRRVW